MTINLNENLNNKYLLAGKEINRAKNILILTHQRPDNDAISSECIMIELMQSLNKKFFAFCKDEISTNIAYLPHTEKISSDTEKLENFDFDLVIFLDCATFERTGVLEKIKFQEKKIIEFDHHPKIENLPSLEIRQPVSSTAEILYDFLKTNRIKINKNYANCILSGIIGDTDSFLHTNTTEKTILISSEMLVYGAQMPKINKNRWFNKSLESMKLWGLALSNLQINKKYNLAFSILKNENMDNISEDEDIYNAITNYFINLYGVRGILFLREENKNIIKGSLRTSYPGVDISILARHLGGGGHPKSSGFCLSGKIKDENGIYKIE